MTVLLNLLKSTVMVDLGDMLPGVGMELRRLDSTEFHAARVAALDAVQKIREGGASLAAYGLDLPDFLGKRLDPADADQMLRVGYLLGTVETAMRGIVRWWGIESEVDGKRVPAPVSREALAVLLIDDAISDRILNEITAAARIVEIEKKTSSDSPNGSLAAGPMESGQRTVPTAESSAPLALAESEGVTESTAPKSN